LKQISVGIGSKKWLSNSPLIPLLCSLIEASRKQNLWCREKEDFIDWCTKTNTLESIKNARLLKGELSLAERFKQWRASFS